MTRDVWEQQVRIVRAHLRGDGYIEQELVDSTGETFHLILRPKSDTLARVSLLVSLSNDFNVKSNVPGEAILNVNAPNGIEVIDYQSVVGGTGGRTHDEMVGID